MKKVSHKWMFLKVLEFLLAILLFRCVVNYCHYTPLNFYNFSISTSILIFFYYAVYSVYLPLTRYYKHYKKTAQDKDAKDKPTDGDIFGSVQTKKKKKPKSRGSSSKKQIRLQRNIDRDLDSESQVRRRKSSSVDIRRSSRLYSQELPKQARHQISSEVVLTTNRKTLSTIDLSGKKSKSRFSNKSKSFLNLSDNGIRRIYTQLSPQLSFSSASKKLKNNPLKRRRKKPFYKRSSWETKVVICLLLNSTNVICQYYVTFDSEIRPIITEEHLELKSRLNQSLNAIFNPKYSQIAQTDPIFFSILLLLSIILFVRLNFSHLRPRVSHLSFFVVFSVILYIVRCIIYASGKTDFGVIF